DLQGQDCLDLFAGSGALGFEAGSRGARRVVLVERDAAAVSALLANRELLGGDAVEVVRADALEFIKHHRGRYDVVFLDPPFADDCWLQLLALLPQCLKPGALVYCERGEALEAGSGWEIFKAGRAGQVSHQLLKRAEHEK
ncbi:MAG: RsmD family RNA methyltransferase, partial [Burkholderiales bacterium]